jgi:hypothetical protein
VAPVRRRAVSGHGSSRAAGRPLHEPGRRKDWTDTVRAVVLDADGKLIGKGHNRVRADLDPSADGETIAIRAAWRRLGAWQMLPPIGDAPREDPKPPLDGRFPPVVSEGRLRERISSSRRRRRRILGRTAIARRPLDQQSKSEKSANRGSLTHTPTNDSPPRLLAVLPSCKDLNPYGRARDDHQC